MPQLQVISRQADPTSQIISDAGNSIANSIRQRQAMELTKRELQIKQKAAETEEEKLKYAQLGAFQDDLTKIKENFQGPAAAVAIKQALRARFGSVEKGMQYFGDVSKSYEDNLKELSQAFSVGENEATPGQSRKAQIDLGQEQNAINRDELGLARERFGLEQSQAPYEQRLKEAQAAEAQAQAGKYGSESRMYDKLLGSMDQGGGMFGGAANPGDTFSLGGYTRQLNPKLTNEENSMVTTGEQVGDLVGQASKLIDQGVLKGAFKKELIGLGNEYAIPDGSPLEEYSGIIKQLTPAVGFTYGGKTFSETEQKILSDLLKPWGKSDKRIKSDLQEFVKKFEEYKKNLVGGSNAARSKMLGGMVPDPDQSGTTTIGRFSVKVKGE